MSNAVARYRVAAAVGGPTLSMQLTGPVAWAAPGGSNLATLSTTAGDLRLLSAGGRGLAVLGASGNVGVGNIAPLYALDVSGAIHASGPVYAPSATFATLVTSNLAVLGAVETVNAYETHSSNVVIANAGTGPALLVTQSGAQPVAAFYAGSNVAMLVDGSGNVNVTSLQINGVNFWTYIVNTYFTVSSGLVCLLSAENTVADSSGASSMVASVTGVGTMTYSTNCKRGSASFVFDNANGALASSKTKSLVVAMNAGFAPPFSMAMWIYSTPPTTGSFMSPFAFSSAADALPTFLREDWDVGGGTGLYMKNTTGGVGGWNALQYYGKWMHVCVTVTSVGGSVVEYVNGASVLSATAASDLVASYLTLGYANGAAAFNGMMDDVRLYNRVLTAFEIGMLTNFRV